MNVTVPVAHELEFTGRYRDRLGANAKKAANIDHDLRSRTSAMDMRHGPDLLITRPVDRSVIEQYPVALRSRTPSLNGNPD